MSDSGSFRIGPIKPAGKPETLSERVSAVFEERFPWVEVTVEHIPSSIKGNGIYVLTTARSFSRSQLSRVGFKKRDAQQLDAYEVIQWRVPPDIMERAIPGAMQMCPEELTQRVRKLPEHEHARVNNMHSHEDGYVVMDAKYGISRSTFVGEDGDKEKIKIHDLFRKKHIIVPEQQMHDVLGIQETKARA